MLLYYTSSCTRVQLKEPYIYIQTKPHYPSVLIRNCKRILGWCRNDGRLHKLPSLKMSLVMNTGRRRSLLLLSRRCGALNTGVMSGMDPLPSLPLCNATPQPTDFKEESLRHRLFTLSRAGACSYARTHARTQATVRVLQCIPHLVRTVVCLSGQSDYITPHITVLLPHQSTLPSAA